MHLQNVKCWIMTNFRLHNLYNNNMYIIDVFTPEYIGTKFPVNSYNANNETDLIQIIKNCLKKEAGIAEIQICNTENI